MAHSRKRPLYKVETDMGKYAYVFGRNRALQLKKNLEEGDVFIYPPAKKTRMTIVKKPSKTQLFEGKINNLFTDRPLIKKKVKKLGKKKGKKKKK